jgi:hypothetical protein
MHSALATTNQAWGFFGAMRHHADPEDAWRIAMDLITTKVGSAETATRAFLDSRYGRHFADEVANGLARGLPLKAAIRAAVELWSAWTISRRTSGETGIPVGLPYLHGFVMHCEIESE